MSKISLLPLLAGASVDGTETLPVVKAGTMVRIPAGTLIERLAQPSITAAQGWANQALTSASALALAIGIVGVLSADIVNTTIGTAPVVGTALSAGRSYATNYVVPSSGKLREVSLDIRTLGSGQLELVLFAGSGTSYAPVWRQAVTATATGAQKFNALQHFTAPDVQAGWVLGLYSPAGGAVPSYSGAGGYYYLAGDPGAVGSVAQLYVASGQAVVVQAVISRDPFSRRAVVDGMRPNLAILADDIVDSAPIGVALPVAGVASVSAGRAALTGVSLSSGKLKSVTAFYQRAGWIDLMLFAGSALNYAPVWRQTVFVNGTGLQSLTAGVDFADVPDVQDGSRLGFYTYVNGATPTLAVSGLYYYRDGDPGAPGAAALAYQQSGNTLQAYVVISTTPTAIEAAARKAGDVAGYRAHAVQRQSRGVANIYASGETGYSFGGNRTFVANFSSTPIRNGIVDRFGMDVLSLGSNGGVVDLVVYDKITHPDYYRPAYRRTVTLTKTGRNEFYAGQHFDAIPIKRNQYIGLVIPANGPTIVGGITGTHYYFVGDPGAATFQGVGSASAPQLYVNIVDDLDKVALPHLGKRVKFFGDSIVYGALFIPRFLEVTGLISTGNRGVVGQLGNTMTDGILPGATTTINGDNGDMTGVDVAVIGTFVNNWHHGGSAAGVYGDARTANTIHGAVRKCHEDIYAANPNTMLYFLGPFNSGLYDTGPAYDAANGAGLTITGLTAAMKDACGRWGSRLYPTQELSGVNQLNLTTHLPDRLHPGQPMAERWGEDAGRDLNRFQLR